MISLEFLLTSLIVVIMPGTGSIYTMSTGILQGRRASFLAAIGCTASILPHITAAIIGLTLLTQMNTAVFQ
ncbi:MAG: LysE family transporter, partial [Chloroflexota bacterium]